jgi:hypothetical protein
MTDALPLDMLGARVTHAHNPSQDIAAANNYVMSSRQWMDDEPSLWKTPEWSGWCMRMGTTSATGSMRVGQDTGRSSRRANHIRKPSRSTASGFRCARIASRGRRARQSGVGARPDARPLEELEARTAGAGPRDGLRASPSRPSAQGQPTALRTGARAASNARGTATEAGMSLQLPSCPDRAVTVSASPPDPRAVEMAHYPPGQADVQNSLPGRHGAGRARSRRQLCARPLHKGLRAYERIEAATPAGGDSDAYRDRAPAARQPPESGHSDGPCSYSGRAARRCP